MSAHRPNGHWGFARFRVMLIDEFQWVGILMRTQRLAFVQLRMMPALAYIL